MKKDSRSNACDLIRGNSIDLKSIFFDQTWVGTKMKNVVFAKHKLYKSTLKSALLAVLASSVVSCGGGGDVSGVTDATPAPAPSVASVKTAAQLKTFWARYGAKESFSPMYGEVLTKLLEAEDLVVAKEFQAARVIVVDLITKYPLMNGAMPNDSVWWNNYNEGQNKSTRPHLGEPGPYAHLRMLDDITKMGVEKGSLPGNTPIQMAIVVPQCSDIVPISGPTLMNERISPEIEENSYEAVRQSLRLLQSYLLAISGGELRLELNFYKINSCFQINKNNRYVLDSNPPLLELPAGVIEKMDMFWLIYPMDFDANVKYGFSSGVGSYNEKPVFISEDDWIIKKRAPDQGSGFRTDVERRMYLPEWFQHELFHHLFASWPELNLGATGHPWFDKSTWPTDFFGREEEDYFSEALTKRLYSANPTIAKKLKRAAQ